MKRFNLLILALVLVWCAGCSLLPSFRVFEKKVDPTLAEKAPVQIEAERSGAKFIEIRLARLIAGKDLPDYIRNDVGEIYAVAVVLSSSLGEPKNPVSIDNQAVVIAALRAGLLAEQKKTDAWKAFAKKYGGKEIEGTGVDLAPWGGGFSIILIIAACIFIPGFGTVVLLFIKKLRGTVQSVAQSVEEYSAAHPEAGKELKEYFDATMDQAHKAVIATEQKFVDWAKVAKVAQTQPVPPVAPAGGST